MVDRKTRLIEQNQFYGKKDIFALYQNERATIQLMDNAYNECKDDNILKQLFHIINFDKGSINRTHNIFKKSKVDDGGKANNENWLIYLRWLLKRDVNQFIEFLKYNPALKCSLFFEYVSPREFMYYQVKTNKRTKIISGFWGLLKDIHDHTNQLVYKTLVNTIVSYIRFGSEFQKWQIAKMIHTPKYSKRQKRGRDGNIIEGGRALQKETKDKFFLYESLCDDVSKEMDWYVIDYGNNKRYTGLIEWRRDYISDTEFVLFSNKKILEFDKEQFMKWLQQLPAGARMRVKKRLYNPEKEDKWTNKYGNLKDFFDAWNNMKLDAQLKERQLLEKERMQGLNDDEKRELAKVKKDAKVNTGALTLYDYINEFVNGKTDDVTVDAIVSKVNFDLEVLVISDSSGSMKFSGGRPLIIARLLTTLAMLKNKHSYSNVLFTFGSQAYVFSDGAEGLNRTNRFMQGQSVKINKLIDRTDTFINNYKKISTLITGDDGSTNISGVAQKIKEWVDEIPELKQIRQEQLSEYQAFLVVSDGDLNNSYSAASSITDMQMKMKQWFGWDGIIIIWDVTRNDNEKINKSGYFDNIENVVHITTYDASTINQIFTKINDIDIIDVYTPLKSLYYSTRYDVIKNYVI